MQIAKIKDNAVEKIGEHRDLFPNVSVFLHLAHHLIG